MPARVPAAKLGQTPRKGATRNCTQPHTRRVPRLSSSQQATSTCSRVEPVRLGTSKGERAVMNGRHAAAAWCYHAASPQQPTKGLQPAAGSFCGWRGRFMSASCSVCRNSLTMFGFSGSQAHAWERHVCEALARSSASPAVMAAYRVRWPGRDRARPSRPHMQRRDPQWRATLRRGRDGRLLWLRL